MDSRRIEHYRIYMKIYGTLIIELADHDEEIEKFITCKSPCSLLLALREVIEDAIFYK